MSGENTLDLRSQHIMTGKLYAQIQCECGYVMYQEDKNDYVCLNNKCSKFKKHFSVISGLSIELMEK